MRTIAMLAALVTAAIAGCTPAIPDGRIACTRDGDCPPGFSCRGTRCFAGAGGTDAGSDGGGMDGAVDAGRDTGVDAGGTDTGMPLDTNVPFDTGIDASAVDTGVPPVDADVDAFTAMDAGNDAFVPVDAGNDAFVPVDGGNDASYGCDTSVCVPGTTQTCTVTSGSCTATGTQTCSASCAFSACVGPTEVCNRMDDDCDGDVDENLLVAGTSVSIAPSASGARVDWSASRSELGVVFGVPAGSVNEVYFARLGPTGARIGTAVRVAADASSWDVTDDGSHWTVVVNEPDGGTGRRVHVFRVDAATTVVTPLNTFTPSATPLTDVRVARLQVIDDVVVGWQESGDGGHAAQLRYSGATSAAAPTMIGTVYDLARDYSAPASGLEVVTTTTGATFVRIRWNGTMYSLQQVRVSGAGFATGPSRNAFGVNVRIRDLAGGLVSPVRSSYLYYDQSNGQTRVAAFNDSTANYWDVLVTGGPTQLVTSGDAIGVVNPGGTSTIERRRPSDGAVVDTAPVSFGGNILDIAGIVTGEPLRFLAITGAGTGGSDMRAVPVECR